MSKPSQKVLDLEKAIDVAIDRLEEIDERGGGPAWLRAKDILGSDLYLILNGLQKARSSTE